jgi:hypothetical protein
MIKSILIIIAVSIFFAFGLRGYIGFFEVFSIITGLQILGSFIYKSLKISNAESLKLEFEDAYNSLLALSRTNFSCPCGRKTFTEELFVNDDNRFNCDLCGSEFTVRLKAEPVLSTEIIDINQTFEDLKKKASNLEGTSV